MGREGVSPKILRTLDRILHIEALSIVLLLATAAALIWANSPAAHGHHEFWETRVAFGFGAFSAGLAFDDAQRLGAAKFGVLVASAHRSLRRPIVTATAAGTS